MRMYTALRHAEQGPYNPDIALALCEEQYWSDTKAQKAFPGLGDYWTGLNATLAHRRLEGYLVNDDGSPVAVVVYTRQFDIHYGLIAAPILVINKIEHRGNIRIAREVLKLIKLVVQRLNADKYLVCHHLSDTTQIIRMRHLNGRS